MYKPNSFVNFNSNDFNSPTEWVPLIPKGDAYYKDGIMHQDNHTIEVRAKRKPFTRIPAFSDAVDPSSLHNQTAWGKLSRKPDSVSKSDLEHITNNQPAPPIKSIQSITETTPNQANTAATNTANQAEKSQPSTLSTAANNTSTAAAEINTGSQLVKEILGDRAGKLKQLGTDHLETVAKFDKDMVLFENGQLHGTRAQTYTYYREEIEAMTEKARKIGMEAYEQYGEFAQKAYIAGTLAQFAHRIGNLADGYELGARVITAIENNTISDWQKVNGQITKMAANLVGGAVAVDIGMFTGAILAGMGTPAILATGLAIGVGVGSAIVISEVADYLDTKLSQGKNPFDFSSDDNSSTEIVLAGDIDYSQYGEKTLIKADNLTLIGNQQFENLEIQSKSLNLGGSFYSKDTMIINSEKFNYIQFKDTSRQNQSPDTANQAAQPEVEEQAASAAKSAAKPQTESEAERLKASDILEQPPKLDLKTITRFEAGIATDEEIDKIEHYREWMQKHGNVYPDNGISPDMLPDLQSGALIQ